MSLSLPLTSQNQHNQHDNSIYFIPFQNWILTQAHRYNIPQVQA